MKTLTEEQAWRALQVVFDYRLGFCKAIERLQNAGLITQDTNWRMLSRFSNLPNVPSEENGGMRFYKFHVKPAYEDATRMSFAERQAKLSRRRKKR